MIEKKLREDWKHVPAEISPTAHILGSDYVEAAKDILALCSVVKTLRRMLRNTEDLALRMADFGAFENSGCASEPDLADIKRLRKKRQR
jgi:hypothetical protein